MQITAWEFPDEKIRSEYGIITYKEWMKKEVDRINPVRCYIKNRETKRGKKIAIFQRG